MSIPFPTPPAPVNASALLVAIIQGHLDEDLDRLAQAISARIKQRRATTAAVTMATLKPGDRIRLNARVRPQYMAGALGTVKVLRQGKIEVDLDRPAGRFYRGVIVPATLVEPAPTSPAPIPQPVPRIEPVRVA